ncbi:MAG: glycosyltransferase family 2 protein [Parcubacteria group bacterium]|nr:glycosyltransferase family 2 protein [Parcubacteria group bacterium]
MPDYYLNISRASDLADKKERTIYRFLEILPGFLAWATVILAVFFSWARPVWAAFFIIIFDSYWLFKVVFLSLHLRSSFWKMKKNLSADWLNILKKDPKTAGWENIYHLVIFPTYKESETVVDLSLEAVKNSNYPKDKIIVVLGLEERAGQAAQKIGEKMREKYDGVFYQFLLTRHPANLEGEIAGKGSNETWAAQEAKKRIVDPFRIPYENILVSSFDADTQIFPDYFGILTYRYLKNAKTERVSYQPIPIYNNNIWDAPNFSRVVATSGTFWQMMQQERPERLSSFSSHAIPFISLVKMDFWQTNIVSEDSRIFWRALFFYDGNFSVEPLHYPVSMDAPLADKFYQTAVNVYKQQRRWGWGVENAPYIIFGFFKNKKIPFLTKLYFSFNQLEGFWSWSTNALIIYFLGWLPLFLGGLKFNQTILAKSLPQITKILMTLALVGALSSAIYSTRLLPEKKDKSIWQYFSVFLQWILLPLTIMIFGAIPGLEAQTRLMLGRYMGFWVTPKIRKNENYSK